MGTSSIDANEVTLVMERVLSWPAPKRLELAQQILATLPTAAQTPRGPSAKEVIARFTTTNPPPNDATVTQWIHDHRVEKYGT